MRLSIVIPALEEAADITATLAALQPLRARGHEVIVVDGGSRDATLLIARLLADRAFTASPGRAAQMNAGARKATGDAFLFLHAGAGSTSRFAAGRGSSGSLPS
jgi:glycosyltransferase involved in cell wall biosynthesis